MKINKETTFIIPSMMMDKLVEWNIKTIMPYIKRMELHSTPNHNDRAVNQLEFPDDDYIKRRVIRQTIEDDCIVKGSFILNKKFDDVIKRVDEIQKKMSHKLNAKVDRIISTYGGQEMIWEVRDHTVLDEKLRDHLEGTVERPGVLRDNLPYNQLRMLICTNSSSIENRVKEGIIMEAKKNVKKFCVAKEIIIEKKISSVIYGMIE